MRDMAEWTGLGAIGQIAITVQDIPRAVTFYRDVLGLRFLFEAPPALAFFDASGVRLMLSRPEGDGSGHMASPIYFRVNHIGEAFDALASRGAVFEGSPHLVARLPDHDLWLAFLKDSEGNILALMEERRE